MNLPTWITFSRLLGVPFILYLLYEPTASSRWVCLIIFLIAAGTDWLDGYLARKLDLVSDLGKFLDPLVDKLLVFAPLLALIELGQIPAWAVFVILARELAIAGWRVNQPKISGANIWGKLKTVSQIIAIALLIAPLPSPWETTALLAFWVALALTLISGLIYVLPQPPLSSSEPQ
ncbi:MAG: CDP-diacylglycerol--glycerol-3-phosphate 3-phosphatidyltransferase [Jaaginema sp. PMC 1079.18]|nr:CDP-diacylglycerol--glycerol-3-phosphate 3-phosphatidyltransferase [Jaaginema sp. PMC 1080.18]MEC4851457.1 CDP-diacylglycerol--glycerol-3-phosphate 3-phosphatidyltransferase [Jaaginema sp. PMC 1079.18]MEC4865955.1 CDP-diacylglycerol--glycerol-3-phosphate 3-phosphatidyltransferase [Jaaginema sp. PMC 1078.18]